MDTSGTYNADSCYAHRKEFINELDNERSSLVQIMFVRCMRMRCGVQVARTAEWEKQRERTEWCASVTSYVYRQLLLRLSLVARSHTHTHSRISAKLENMIRLKKALNDSIWCPCAAYPSLVTWETKEKRKCYSHTHQTGTHESTSLPSSRQHSMAQRHKKDWTEKQSLTHPNS